MRPRDSSISYNFSRQTSCKVQGKTSFEEIECLGLFPEENLVEAIIRARPRMCPGSIGVEHGENTVRR